MMRIASMLLAGAAALRRADGPLPLSLKRAVEIAASPGRQHERSAFRRGAEAGAGAVGAGAGVAAAGPLRVDRRAEPDGQPRRAWGSGSTCRFPGSASRAWSGRSRPWTRASAASQTVFDFARSGASRRRRWASRRRSRMSANVTDAVAAQVARAYLAAVKARRGRGSGAGQHRARAGGAEAGGEPESGGHRHRHRDHAREGAACQRPAAPAGRRRTRAARRICGCCARSGCGWTPTCS